jgi:PhnB protein
VIDMNLNPQIGLTFAGNCEAAFRFYERHLNGKVEFILRWGESPMANDASPGWRDKVLHARLVINGVPLLGGDVLPESFESAQGFSILLHPKDAGEAERVFQALAENGTVRMPLQETFWSPRFGCVIDQFGISWTINYEKSE